MGFFTLLLLLFFDLSCLTLNKFTVDAQEICKNKTLKPKINTAILKINNQLSNDILLSMQSEECWNCDLITKYRVSADGKCEIRVDTRWLLIYAFNLTNNQDHFCLEKFHFQENGIFNTEITNNENDSQILCSKPNLSNHPVTSNEPIFIALGTLIGIYILSSVLYHFRNSTIFRRIRFRFAQESLIEADSYIQQDLGSPDSINPTDDTESLNNRPIIRERLKSLDAFRGISIVIMIFVNYGGGQYWFFHHSPWNGLTVADIVFPWFIFIMGTSMAYSFRSMLRRGMKKMIVFQKILWRTIVLFLLGIMVNCISTKDIDITNIRIPGVLQRFAITYLIVGVMHMLSARPADSHQFVWWTSIQEIVIYWPDWVVSVVLLVIYIAVTFGVYISPCGRGYIGPAGLSNHSYLNQTTCVGGVASYIDHKIFSNSHIYQRGTFRQVYHSQGFHDPEGLLGTLTSCVLCSLGLEAGKIFLMYRPPPQRVKRFLIWAVILGSTALLLTKASKDDGWIPINKNLWSVSFIFATGGLAYLMLTFCYLTIDVWKIWSGSPFYWAGMNAIALYLGHEILAHKFPVHWQGLNTHWYQLLMNLWGTIFWILIAGFMHYKKIYFSI